MKPHAGMNVNAGVSPVVAGNRGFSSTITRVAAGHYRLTLDNGLAQNEMLILTQINEDITNAGANGVSNVTVGAVTTIDVKTWLNTGLTDLDFAIGVFNLRA